MCGFAVWKAIFSCWIQNFVNCCAPSTVAGRASGGMFGSGCEVVVVAGVVVADALGVVVGESTELAVAVEPGCSDEPEHPLTRHSSTPTVAATTHFPGLLTSTSPSRRSALGQRRLSRVCREGAVLAHRHPQAESPFGGIWWGRTCGIRHARPANQRNSAAHVPLRGLMSTQQSHQPHRQQQTTLPKTAKDVAR